MAAVIPEAAPAVTEGTAAVIPEAAPAVTEGTAAVRGAAAGPARRPRPAGQAREYGKRAARGAAAGPALRPRLARQARKYGKRKAREYGKRAARGAMRARVPGNRQYQPVILAEFLVAVLVVAIPPLAKGGDTTAQAKGAPSPYSTDSLKQLLAVGAVYFILAIMSGSKRLGRTSAWFGGLVLLGLGLIQTANGDLTALFKIFGPGTGAGAAGVSGGGTLPPLEQPGQDLGAQLQASAQNALGPTPQGLVTEVLAPVTEVSPPAGGTGTVTTPGG